MDTVSIEMNNLERDALLRAIDKVKIPNSAMASVIRIQEVLLDGRDWFTAATAPAIMNPMTKFQASISKPDIQAAAMIAELVKHADHGNHALEGLLAIPLEKLRLRLQALLEEKPVENVSA